MDFGFATHEHWRIHEDVDATRRAALMAETPFKFIVEGLVAGISKISVHLEPSKEPKGYSRRWVEIFTNEVFVDLWHNGCGGYRAQYLLSEKEGERANSYAVEKLHTAILPTLRARALTDCEIEDLGAPQAKTWIKEGLWWRHAKKGVVEIETSIWRDLKEVEAKYLEKARAGRLLPNGDPRLVLKPIWRSDEDGQPPPENVLTKDRTEQIRTYGYT